MIYCTLSSLSRFKTCSENFGKAIHFLENTDLSALHMGKTVICDDSIYINKVEIDSKNADHIKFESHKRYMDIHIVLVGDEKIQSIDSATSTTEYNEADDYTLFESNSYSTEVVLSIKDCAIYFANEIHKPGIRNSSENITKCIVKVLEDGR